MRAQPDAMREFTREARIAYFSMEITLEPEILNYSGGLGLLASDTVRSAADVRILRVAVALVGRAGYFIQLLRADGLQCGCCRRATYLHGRRMRVAVSLRVPVTPLYAGYHERAVCASTCVACHGHDGECAPRLLNKAYANAKTDDALLHSAFGS